MAAQADNDRHTAQYGNEQARPGHAAETHQVAGDCGPRLTTQQGVVVGDDQNTLRAGDRGPAQAS